MMVDKICSVENLVDPLIKILTERVFIDNRDNIGFR